MDSCEQHPKLILVLIASCAHVVRCMSSEVPSCLDVVLRLPFPPHVTLVRRCRDRAEELLLPHLIAFARLAIARFALRHGVPARTGPSALRSARGAADADGARPGGDRGRAASAEVLPELQHHASYAASQMLGVDRHWTELPGSNIH